MYDNVDIETLNFLTGHHTVNHCDGLHVEQVVFYSRWDLDHKVHIYTHDRCLLGNALVYEPAAVVLRGL